MVNRKSGIYVAITLLLLGSYSYHNLNFLLICTLLNGNIVIIN
jgi:hypothetical protein